MQADTIDLYSERVGPGLRGEPLNAVVLYSLTHTMMAHGRRAA